MRLALLKRINVDSALMDRTSAAAFALKCCRWFLIGCIGIPVAVVTTLHSLAGTHPKPSWGEFYLLLAIGTIVFTPLVFVVTWISKAIANRLFSKQGPSPPAIPRTSSGTETPHTIPESNAISGTAPGKNLEANDEHYEIAGLELVTGKTKPGLWAKALAITDGDEQRSKAAYVRFRVEQLVRAKAQGLEAAVDPQRGDKGACAPDEKVRFVAGEAPFKKPFDDVSPESKMTSPVDDKLWAELYSRGNAIADAHAKAVQEREAKRKAETAMTAKTDAEAKANASFKLRSKEIADEKRGVETSHHVASFMWNFAVGTFFVVLAVGLVVIVSIMAGWL